MAAAAARRGLSRHAALEAAQEVAEATRCRAGSRPVETVRVRESSLYCFEPALLTEPARLSRDGAARRSRRGRIRAGMLHAWVGQIVLECNELRRNSLTREQCSRRVSAGQQLLCPACEWHAQHACACHSRIGAALPLHLRARRLHCIRALLRHVDTCADGCCRARPEASSHQVLASVSRQHCQLVWLLPG